MPYYLISPFVLFTIALALTAVVAGIDRLVSRSRRKALSALARESHMHYSARDVFGLAARVAPHLPVMGAADVRVGDLIYGSNPEGLRYVFATDYTIGVVHSKSRRRCVVSVLEPKAGTSWTSLKIAPEELPLLDQYQVLLKAPQS